MSIEVIDEALELLRIAQSGMGPDPEYLDRYDQHHWDRISKCREGLEKLKQQEPVAWILECQIAGGAIGQKLSWSRRLQGLERPLYAVPAPTSIEHLQAIADAVEVTPEVAEHLKRSRKQEEAEIEKEVQAARVTNEALGRGYSAAPASAVPDGVAEAPPNSLPTWDECALRVANSDFIVKRVAEGGYGPEPDSKLATQLHRFIYEYDDKDQHRSAWFLHRLELVLEEVKQEAGSAAPVPAAVLEGCKLVPAEVLDKFPEINPSNYDHDDVCRLNEWGGELVLSAADANSVHAAVPEGWRTLVSDVLAYFDTPAHDFSAEQEQRLIVRLQTMLSAAPASAAVPPLGRKMAPNEATDEMISAASKTWANMSPSIRKRHEMWLRNDYRAMLSAVPAAPAVPDVDWLSNVIRAADGGNNLGAGALAEKIVEAMQKGGTTC